MRRSLLLLALLSTLAILLPAGPAFAEEGEITVLDVDAESQFPDGVRFSVTAQSSDEIDEIRVFLKRTGETGSSSYRSVDFEPGTLVTGESILSTSGGGDYFPPGTQIRYSFEIRDKAGAVHRTPEEDFIYDDGRFEWQTVSSGLISVDYYGEYVEQRAQTILEAAEETLEIMGPLLGIEPTEPLRIVSYNNYRHMSAALPFRSQAVREHLQTSGMAFDDERVLLVLGFDATITGTVSHEFIHLLVAEAAGRTRSQVPAWLNEGLAEYGNIDRTDDYEAALRYGIFTRRLRPLWFQHAFTGSPEDIIIAYGQGQSVVTFLIDRFGEETIAELFQALQRTLNIDTALEEVYGLDQYGVDSEWRKAIGLDPLPPPGELERQLEMIETPDPAEQTEEGAATPAAAAESEPEPAETAEGSQAKEAEADESEPAPGGCNAPAYGDSSPAGSIALGSLLVLGAPLGLISLRAFQRSRREEGDPTQVTEPLD